MRHILTAVVLALCACDSTPSTPPPSDLGQRAPDAEAPSDAPGSDAADARPEWPSDAAVDGAAAPTVTQGVAPTSATCAPSATCTNPRAGNVRETLCGRVTAADGSAWEVPGPVTDARAAVDVFNDCTGTGANPGYAASLTTTVVNPGGAVITAHLFADNYFELYVNGVAVARDAIGFTPFNASAVRFQATYPITYAVSLIDWEGFLGVGLETGGAGFHIGDGGFTAAFSDGVATDAAWRCRPYYISPLDDASCITADARGTPDSSRCPSTDATVGCVGRDPTRACRAAHYRLPADWMAPGFDDSSWPAATLYAAAQVTNQPAYVDYATSLFAGARFIWTSNLNLDNHILCRVTVRGPR